MDIESFKRRPIELNLSPLIDVIFILVIFIVLVARFIDQNQLDVDVPDSKVGRPATVEALVVHVTVDGTVHVGDRRVADDELEAVLAPLRQAHERVLLMADGQIALQKAVDVLSAARAAGFEQVSLATDPKQAARGASSTTAE